MSDEEEDIEERLKESSRVEKRKKVTKNEFIDDEAELSGDDEISEDELENSDDDQIDLELVDKDAQELDSEEEEEVRGLYHKQLEADDKRALLLLQEQLEDKDVAIGQQRRRKFRWQTKEMMENSLRRHYDPDDDDSQEGEDDDSDEEDYDEMKPRLRRPTTESLLIGTTRIFTKQFDNSSLSNSSIPTRSARQHPQGPVAGPSAGFSDDSNSNTISNRLTYGTKSNAASDINRFLFRDREVVEALSHKETVITSREDREKTIQRELKRVLSSKSIFDQLYS